MLSGFHVLAAWYVFVQLHLFYSVLTPWQCDFASHLWNSGKLSESPKICAVHLFFLGCLLPCAIIFKTWEALARCWRIVLMLVLTGSTQAEYKGTHGSPHSSSVWGATKEQGARLQNSRGSRSPGGSGRPLKGWVRGTET